MQVINAGNGLPKKKAILVNAHNGNFGNQHKIKAFGIRQMNITPLMHEPDEL